MDHAICDYEGTSYRARFWEGQDREYEDLAERIALRQLLPPRGRRIVEVGAGFGRLADLYSGYEQVILLDYARSGLREAQERLGASGRFIYVAADLYHLPLAPGAYDTAVTVRVLHHLENVPAALRQIAMALRPGGAYVLEYANKRNLKAIFRYLLHRQAWSPFTPEPYEFVRLNFDFHPTWMTRELKRAGFAVDTGKAVSHFRDPFLKRIVSPGVLAAVDGLFQNPGAVWKLSPSIFLRAHTAPAGATADADVVRDASATESPCRVRDAARGGTAGRNVGQVGNLSHKPVARPEGGLFCCPMCRSRDLISAADALVCAGCGAVWPTAEGIYDFKTPLEPGVKPLDAGSKA